MNIQVERARTAFTEPSNNRISVTITAPVRSSAVSTFYDLYTLRNDGIITGPCQQACHNSHVVFGRIYNENLVNCFGSKI